MTASARRLVSRRSSPATSRLTTAARGAVPLLVYLLISVAYFGRPVLGELGSVAIAQDDVDSSAYMWFLAWWPHAVLEGVNPFITHAIFVPEGVNLTWTTSMPGPALLLAPVTMLAGPVVSYNLWMVAAPALSAWAGFTLCRHLTGAVWPSAVGGYLFGFSPYVLQVLRGAPNLAMIALVPVFVLLVLKRLEGSLSPRRFVVLMATCFVAQFLVATEVLALTTLFGGFALLFAYLLFAARRPALVNTVGLILLGGAAAIVIVSPWLYYMLKPHTSPTHVDPLVFSLDVYSFLVPGELVWHGKEQAEQWAKLGIGYLIGGPSYFGLPLLVILGAFAVQRRRDRRAVLVVLCLLTCVIASLGPRLLFSGKPRVTMPWEIATHLPLLKYAIPQRLPAFTFLAVAVIVALWLSQRGGRLRWALALLAVISLVPNLRGGLWRSPAQDPAFFSRDSYKAYLSPRDHVLTVPSRGRNQRWQANTDFGFEIVGGYVGQFPPSYTRYPTWRTTVTGRLSRDYARQLRSYVADKGVTAIVVEKREPGPWRQLFAPLGIKPIDAGEVLVYRLAPPR